MWKYWYPKTDLFVDDLRKITQIKVGEWSEKFPNSLGLESNGEYLKATLAMKRLSSLRGDEEPRKPMSIVEFRRRVNTGDEKSQLIEFLSYELEVEFLEDFSSSPPIL